MIAKRETCIVFLSSVVFLISHNLGLVQNKTILPGNNRVRCFVKLKKNHDLNEEENIILEFYSLFYNKVFFI